MHAELDGLICSGPRRGPVQTYALLEERVPPAPVRGRDEALAELAERYVTGHGPAQAIDLAWWSGLTVRDARRALELAGSSVVREQVDGRELWTAASGDGVAVEWPAIRLLPNWDELLVAFRDRTDAVSPALPAAARTPVALLSNTVVRDGLVIGTWRRTWQRDRLRIRPTIHVALDPIERARLELAAADLARFLGGPGAAVTVD
jgi:hypothetical protein